MLLLFESNVIIIPTERVGERIGLSRIMEIILNTDEEVVKTVKEGLKAKDGYCPCRLERTEDNKCMCKEFREQIKDPNFEGYCHCRLYYKKL